ncbi:ankyrin, partial [Gonapodya prolifera JEL478]
LTVAARNGCLNAVRFLLEKGADLHYNNHEAIRLAASYVAGAQFTPESFDGALHQATLYGNDKFVRFCAERGADVNFFDGGCLILGAEDGNLDVVEALMDFEADVSAQGCKAVFDTSRCDHRHILKLMKDRGVLCQNANMNATAGRRKSQALVKAADHGRLDAVRYLLEKGANLHYNRNEAIRCAALSGHKDVVEVLLGKGADGGQRSALNGILLDTAAQRGNVELVEFLVDSVAAAQLRQEDLDGALYKAAIIGHAKVVRFLADPGADVNYVGGESLVWGAEDGNLEVVEALLDCGADFSVQGYKAVFDAFRCGHKHILKLMRDRGVDVD